MKNFFNVTCLVFLVFGLWSCSGDQSISLTESGEFNINISLDGSGIQDAIVDLYNIDGGLLYDRKLTGANGSAQFGRYNSNDYLLSIEAETNNEFFRFEKVVQIVSDVTRNLDVKLEDYYVPVNINVLDASSGEPFNLSGYKVVFVPNELVANAYDEDAVKETLATYGVEVSLANGKASLDKLPVNHYYVAMISAEGEIVLTISAHLKQYEDDVVRFYVNGISLLLMSKPSFEVLSVQDIYTSANISHNYKSIAFSENKATLTEKDGSTIEAFYSTSSSGSSGYYLNFDWPISNYWSDANIEISGSNILLTLYDYSLNSEVVITLK